MSLKVLILVLCTLFAVTVTQNCADWQTTEPCSLNVAEICMQTAVRACVVGNYTSWEIADIECLESDCQGPPPPLGDAGDDSEGDEDEDDSSEGDEDDGMSEGDDVEDDSNLIPDGQEPGNLDTGKEFCVSDCSSQFDFLATYQTGLRNSEQKLCENEITNAITGRGGAECRVDDWFVVEECDDNCYEFGWRASYPTYCNVEDRWLWCCPPKIQIESVTLCGDYQERDIACLVTDYWPVVDSITISWFNDAGIDLGEIDGYDISTTYNIDNDKVLSVLTVKSSAIEGTWAKVTCHVTRAGSDKVYEESAIIRKYNVIMSEWLVKKLGQEVVLTCYGEGADGHAYFFEWYYLDAFGEKQVADDPRKFSVEEELVDGEWMSSLTVHEAGQRLGDQVFQCVLHHIDVDRCGNEHISVCSGGTGFSIWDITTDTYCAHPGEGAILEFTILGSNNYTTIEAVVVESLLRGTVIDSDTLPSTGYQLTGTYNEKDELVVQLTIAPSRTTDIGSELFISYRKGDGSEENLEPNLELNVMGVTGGQGGTSSLKPGGSDIIVYVIVEGGTMDPPIWVDDQGRIYKLGENREGVVVELSEDQKSSTLTVPKEAVEKLGITEFYVSVRLFSETGTYCRRQKIYIELGVSECKVVWDAHVCDRRISCSDYMQWRTWTCECSDGNNDPSRCTEPTEELEFTCPATVSYELGPWERENCNEKNCYPYPLQKKRPCYCVDVGGHHLDYTGNKCDEAEMVQTYYCPASKPWTPGPWKLGECPEESCFESDTVDTRECYCDEINTDRTKCDEDLVSVRICEPTKEFEWGPWGEEVCETKDRCYPTWETKNRACICENYGTLYKDPTMCKGEDMARYTCAANMEWYPEEIGDPCRESDTISCMAFTAPQQYRCKCDLGNIAEVDYNLELCDAPEVLKVCPANQVYEWSRWSAASDCSLCYPELDQTFTRTCGCGYKEDSTRCDGPSWKSEPCPATKNRVWLPTEWSELPCGELSCYTETFTTRTRDCECEGTKDRGRCEESMTDVKSCGYKPYELTKWGETECDAKLCIPYTKTKKRSCFCRDISGPSTDLSKCDPGYYGYETEFECAGDIYEWGEWQSRGCPDSCYSTKTKRYRICSCHGNVDFNECGKGSAIEFYDCPPTKECYT